jgi:predicted metal-dependent enzyme (double-stranded beta helix superfamily)
MFDLQAFIEECRRLAARHEPRRILELMREAVGDPDALKRAVTPLDAKVGVFDAPLYRSHDLTVLNVTLRPGVLSIPHDHGMWAVIGIYEGQENNTFFRRSGPALDRANTREVRAGEAILLGADVVHAIENPLPAQTLGLHVYGGDLFAAERSMWSPHTGEEHPYDIPQFTRWSGELARARRAAAAPAQDARP